jgi:hypothetical protein
MVRVVLLFRFSEKAAVTAVLSIISFLSLLEKRIPIKIFFPVMDFFNTLDRLVRFDHDASF